MMRRNVKKRRMLLALAAPMLLVGACAQVDSESGELEELRVATDTANGRVTAVYQSGDGAIQLVTRRIVTDVTEAAGVRTKKYIQVDASASEFDVEVTAVDAQRGIRLVADGDGVSVDSDGASLADQERAMALFGEAMVALAASDAAIPVAERRVLGQLGDQAATNPGFEAPPVLTPLDEDDGCRGAVDEPSVSSYSQSVRSSAQIVCLGDGEEHKMKFELCIHGEVLETAAEGTVCDSGGGGCSTAASAVSGRIVCQETEEITFDADELEPQSMEVGANGWCGTERTRYQYRAELKSVTKFHSGWGRIVHWGRLSWHTLDESGEVEDWCGAQPPAPYENDGDFRPWDPP